MKAEIIIREGCPPNVAERIEASTPILDPDHWVTRAAAARALEVNPRTVDRYIRRRELSSYSGPVLDRSPNQSGHGVRVWKDDVVNLHTGVIVQVQR
jgi:hypothetical protein